MAVLLGELSFCIRRGFFSGALLFSCFSFLFLNLWSIIPIITNNWNFGVIKEVTFVVAIFNFGMLAAYVLRWFSFLSPQQHAICVSYGNDIWLPAMMAWLVCLFWVIYFFNVNGIPLLSEDVDMARHLSRKSSGIVNVFVNRGFPLFSIILIGALYLNNKIIPAILVLAFCIVIQFMTAFRANIVFFIIVAFMYWALLKRKFDFLVFIKALVLCLLIFIFVTFLKYQNEFDNYGYLISTYKYLEHRILLELPRVISYCIDLVHAEGLLWGGTYLMDISTIRLGPDIGFGDYLMIFRNPEGSLIGLAPLTPSIIGESFANFGYLGVVVSPFIVLLLFKYLDSTYPFTTSANLAVKVFLSFFVANSVMLGLGGIIVPRVIPLLIFVFGFQFLRHLLVYLSRRHA